MHLWLKRKRDEKPEGQSAYSPSCNPTYNGTIPNDTRAKIEGFLRNDLRRVEFLDGSGRPKRAPCTSEERRALDDMAIDAIFAAAFSGIDTREIHEITGAVYAAVAKSVARQDLKGHADAVLAEAINDASNYVLGIISGSLRIPKNDLSADRYLKAFNKSGKAERLKRNWEQWAKELDPISDAAELVLRD